MYRQPPNQKNLTPEVPERCARRKSKLVSAIARILASSRAKQAATPEARSPALEWMLRMMD